MPIRRVELTRCRIPFRQAFSHAAAKRAESDVIHVALTDAEGRTGFGEIQAREYVTGETNDAIWDEHAAQLTNSLIGESFDTVDAVRDWLESLADRASQPACVGGFDMALHDLVDLSGALDWTTVLGDERTRLVGRCTTIGDDMNDKALIRQARFARLSGCTVAKLKVSGPDDADRCRTLRQHLGDDIAIRLDGNGRMTLDGALALFESIAELNIQSLEEPFDRKLDSTDADLRRLHDQTGVPLVADESACTVADVERCADTDTYQIINVRVGKCGGLTGTRAVLDAARERNLGLVCGTMVGESAVLLRYSKKLLKHCNSLDYVEGIDQNKTLLAEEVITSDDNSALSHFRWHDEARERHSVGAQIFE